jgi:hypothetical protein
MADERVQALAVSTGGRSDRTTAGSARDESLRDARASESNAVPRPRRSSPIRLPAGTIEWTTIDALRSGTGNAPARGDE